MRQSQKNLGTCGLNKKIEEYGQKWKSCVLRMKLERLLKFVLTYNSEENEILASQNEDGLNRVATDHTVVMPVVEEVEE